MKKIYIVIFCIVIILLSILLCINFPKSNDKFNLDKKHYNTEERFIEIEKEELKELLDSKNSFALFTYLPYCTFSIPCDVIFETFLNTNNMSFYKIAFDELDGVEELSEVKYAPSVILINKGKVVSYLDANSDDDLSKYQSVDDFSDWIKKYINIK